MPNIVKPSSATQNSSKRCFNWKNSRVPCVASPSETMRASPMIRRSGSRSENPLPASTVASGMALARIQSTGSSISTPSWRFQPSHEVMPDLDRAGNADRPRNKRVRRGTRPGAGFRRDMRYNAGMRQALRRHPDSRCIAATRVDVDVAQPSAGSLLLSYVVHGDIGELCLMPIAAPARGDELWRHTCFEAFVGTAAGAAYYEFNFAPSTQWAA